MSITVLEDLRTEKCHLTDFELDVDRLAKCGFEIVGHLSRFAPVTLERPIWDEVTYDDGPAFTSCNVDHCPLWIMIDCDGDAPEYCSTHVDEVEA